MQSVFLFYKQSFINIVIQIVSKKSFPQIYKFNANSNWYQCPQVWLLDPES